MPPLIVYILGRHELSGHNIGQVTAHAHSFISPLLRVTLTFLSVLLHFQPHLIFFIGRQCRRTYVVVLSAAKYL